MKWKIGNTTLDILPPVKRYMNAIERHLRVDRKTRVRIMTELASDFQSRRENGQSDEAIMQELGSPEEVAAEFNAALDDETIQPVSRWRWAFVALAAVILLARFILPELFLLQSHTSSIGVIGGADGPTAIFVSTEASSGLWEVLPWLLGCAAGFLAAGWCRRGSGKRYAVPFVVCLLGIVLQLFMVFVLQQMLGLLAGAYLLSQLTTSGVWLCLVVAIWTVWEWRHCKRSNKKK